MNAIYFFDEDMVNMPYHYNTSRGYLIEIHIADIHFGAFDPKVQYEILSIQFLSQISVLPHIDVISIDGDIFDHKLLSNSDAVMYASMFMENVVSICRSHNATLVIIQGTYQHEMNQLKIFYHYLDDPSIDIRIVTNIRFEYIKGAKILCIPELYGVDESVYQKVLSNSGLYDGVYMHGTIKGAVHGDNVGNGRLFTIEDFNLCGGPIISGHVHKSGCFNKYFYYTGTPYRYKYGEEEDKGYFIVLRDLDSRKHYAQFMPIISQTYTTIIIDYKISNDPREIINYINNYKAENNIDYLRVQFHIALDNACTAVIKSYYRNTSTVTIDFLEQIVLEQQEKTEDQYGFIYDRHYSDEEKFVMFCNDREGYEFITVDKLREIMNEE